MKLVPTSITRNLARQMLVAKKNSPHIFFVGGVAGLIGAGVLACRATLKLEKNLDEIKNDLETVRALGEESKKTGTEYAERQYFMDMSQAYGRSIGKVGRLYAPSILLGGVSVAALTGSHIQLTRRNTALTAAFAAVTKAYDEYRLRVQEEIGQEREIEIYRDVQETNVAEEGKKKELVKVQETGGYSPYAKLFDVGNRHWVNNAEMNYAFLRIQQKWANDRLRAYGHLFLNELYDQLGLDRTPAGQVVGWLYNNDAGDNYVDFGLDDDTSMTFRRGWENAVWLDFNVDGVIYDLI